MKHQEQEGTEPTRGLSKDEGESSRLPDNEPMTGTLEHRASRSADRLVLKGETRGKVLGKERQGEDGRVEKPATCTCYGA